ncbi:hypothetical protein HK100_007844 [Physocladia obscura]|uniref:Uncharacterized protein n=1 Tax=Physocladia obscura TaxID=109957 RepID=A0AAD5T4F2_9FUNG|nr:hypothetical protein HK100_007844 [Physocladia obscura]
MEVELSNVVAASDNNRAQSSNQHNDGHYDHRDHTEGQGSSFINTANLASGNTNDNNLSRGSDDSETDTPDLIRLQARQIIRKQNKLRQDSASDTRALGAMLSTVTDNHSGRSFELSAEHSQLNMLNSLNPQISTNIVSLADFFSLASADDIPGIISFENATVVNLIDLPAKKSSPSEKFVCGSQTAQLSPFTTQENTIDFPPLIMQSTSEKFPRPPADKSFSYVESERDVNIANESQRLIALPQVTVPAVALNGDEWDSKNTQPVAKNQNGHRDQAKNPRLVWTESKEPATVSKSQIKNPHRVWKSKEETFAFASKKPKNGNNGTNTQKSEQKIEKMIIAEKKDLPKAKDISIAAFEDDILGDADTETDDEERNHVDGIELERQDVPLLNRLRMWREAGSLFHRNLLDGKLPDSVGPVLSNYSDDKEVLISSEVDISAVRQDLVNSGEGEISGMITKEDLRNEKFGVSSSISSKNSSSSKTSQQKSDTFSNRLKSINLNDVKPFVPSSLHSYYTFPAVDLPDDEWGVFAEPISIPEKKLNEKSKNKTPISKESYSPAHLTSQSVRFKPESALKRDSIEVYEKFVLEDPNKYQFEKYVDQTNDEDLKNDFAIKISKLESEESEDFEVPKLKLKLAPSETPHWKKNADIFEETRKKHQNELQKKQKRIKELKQRPWSFATGNESTNTAIMPSIFPETTIAAVNVSDDEWGMCPPALNPDLFEGFKTSDKLSQRSMSSVSHSTDNSNFPERLLSKNLNKANQSKNQFTLPPNPPSANLKQPETRKKPHAKVADRDRTVIVGKFNGFMKYNDCDEGFGENDTPMKTSAVQVSKEGQIWRRGFIDKDGFAHPGGYVPASKLHSVYEQNSAPTSTQHLENLKKLATLESQNKDAQNLSGKDSKKIDVKKSSRILEPETFISYDCQFPKEQSSILNQPAKFVFEDQETPKNINFNWQASAIPFNSLYHQEELHERVKHSEAKYIQIPAVVEKQEQESKPKMLVRKPVKYRVLYQDELYEEVLEYQCHIPLYRTVLKPIGQKHQETEYVCRVPAKSNDNSAENESEYEYEFRVSARGPGSGADTLNKRVKSQVKSLDVSNSQYQQHYKSVEESCLKNDSAVSVDQIDSSILERSWEQKSNIDFHKVAKTAPDFYPSEDKNRPIVLVDTPATSLVSNFIQSTTTALKPTSERIPLWVPPHGYNYGNTLQQLAPSSNSQQGSISSYAQEPNATGPVSMKNCINAPEFSPYIYNADEFSEDDGVVDDFKIANTENINNIAPGAEKSDLFPGDKTPVISVNTEESISKSKSTKIEDNHSTFKLKVLNQIPEFIPCVTDKQDWGEYYEDDDDDNDDNDDDGYNAKQLTHYYWTERPKTQGWNQGPAMASGVVYYPPPFLSGTAPVRTASTNPGPLWKPSVGFSSPSFTTRKKGERTPTNK